MGRQALTELAQHGAFARMMEAINRRQQKLDDLKNRLDRAARQILEQHRRRLEASAAAVRHYDVRRMLGGIRKELDSRVAALAATARTLLLRQRGRLSQLAGQLEALSPLAILDRGYALVFDSSGALLKDADRVKAGDEISARLAKGTLTATVGRRKQK
jgi:exodeoxyribonuclease VII large subunit